MKRNSSPMIALLLIAAVFLSACTTNPLTSTPTPPSELHPTATPIPAPTQTPSSMVLVIPTAVATQDPAPELQSLYLSPYTRIKGVSSLCPPDSVDTGSNSSANVTRSSATAAIYTPDGQRAVVSWPSLDYSTERTWISNKFRYGGQYYYLIVSEYVTWCLSPSEVDEVKRAETATVVSVATEMAEIDATATALVHPNQIAVARDAQVTASSVRAEATRISVESNASSQPVESGARLSTEELARRAMAFVTARGFYPLAETEADVAIVSERSGGKGQRLVAIPSLCSGSLLLNHHNCQITHFFLEQRYLGTDTLYTYYGYESVRVLSGLSIAVDYQTYSPSDPFCCPSESGSVTYTWTGSKLVASGEPPHPVGKPFEATGLQSVSPHQLTVLLGDGGFQPIKLLLPAGIPVQVQLVNANLVPYLQDSDQKHDMVIEGTPYRLVGSEPGGESTAIVFDQPGVYPFYCPYHHEREAGLIVVVPAME